MRSFDSPLQGWQPSAGAGEPTVSQMLVAATLSLFTELGPSRFARLLDAIAECEHFHELTMIN